MTMTIRVRTGGRWFGKDGRARDSDKCADDDTRHIHRLLASESVRSRWPMCSIDVSASYLRNSTNKEMRKAVGEPGRTQLLFTSQQRTATEEASRLW